jgi:hypothetical protein
VTAAATGATIALPTTKPDGLAPVLCVEIEGAVAPAANRRTVETGKDTAM